MNKILLCIYPTSFTGISYIIYQSYQYNNQKIKVSNKFNDPNYNPFKDPDCNKFITK